MDFLIKDKKSSGFPVLLFYPNLFLPREEAALSLSLSLSLSARLALRTCFFNPLHTRCLYNLYLWWLLKSMCSGCCDHSRGLLVLIFVRWLLRFAMVVEIGMTLGWDHGCGLWLLKLVWWLLTSIVFVKIGMLWLLKVSFFSTLDANALMWKFKRLSMWNKSHEALPMSCN